jgi:hypothetical protein
MNVDFTNTRVYDAFIMCFQVFTVIMHYLTVFLWIHMPSQTPPPPNKRPSNSLSLTSIILCYTAFCALLFCRVFLLYSQYIFCPSYVIALFCILVVSLFSICTVHENFLLCYAAYHKISCTPITTAYHVSILYPSNHNFAQDMTKHIIKHCHNQTFLQIMIMDDNYPKQLKSSGLKLSICITKPKLPYNWSAHGAAPTFL